MTTYQPPLSTPPHTLHQLLHTLHTQLATSSHLAFTPSSTTTSPVLPGPWPCAADRIREMRRALTSMYGSVLTDDEKEQAKRWGWREETQRSVLDQAASSHGSSSGPLVAAAGGSSTSAIYGGSAATFQRFSIPLLPLAQEFRASAESLVQIVSYHHSLITTVHAATTEKNKLGMNIEVNSPILQLQPIARTYLLYYQRRLEFQRQEEKMRRSFLVAHRAIHLELEERKRRATLRAQQELDRSTLVRGPNGHFALPPNDLYSLTASITHIRSELNLLSGNNPNLDTKFVISNQLTIDGRQLPLLANHTIDQTAVATNISSATFTFEKHNINIVSTGTTTCFVLEINLVKPILKTPQDYHTMDTLVEQAIALPNGPSSLHPLSSLSQLLCHGFCIYGTLTTLSSEDPLDIDLVSLIYANEFTAIQAKLAILLEHEQLSEANPTEGLASKPEAVLNVFKELVAQSPANVTDTTNEPASFFILNRLRMESKLEGLRLTFAKSGLPSQIVPRVGSFRPSGIVWESAEYALTFVGMEKVSHMVKLDTNAMDTSTSGGASSTADTFFAFRFLLSHPLALTVSEAQRIFALDFYPPSIAARTSENISDEKAIKPIPNTFHSVAVHPFKSGGLATKDVDGEQATRSYIQQVFDTKQSYLIQTSSASSTPPTILISSFLLRDLSHLSSVIEALRSLYLFQHLYRSCFWTNGTTTTDTQHPHTEETLTRTSPPIAAVSSSQPLSTTTGPSSKKLKFSFRQLLDDPSPVTTEAASMKIDPIKSNPYDPSNITIRLTCLEPTRLLLQTPHPNGASSSDDLVIELIRVPTPGRAAQLPSIRVNSTNQQLYTPSITYASHLLQRTGSIPLMMYYLLQACQRH